jgi:hypothetical protein
MKNIGAELKLQMNADGRRYGSPGTGGYPSMPGRAELLVRRNLSADQRSKVGGPGISLALDWNSRRRGNAALPDLA